MVCILYKRMNLKRNLKTLSLINIMIRFIQIIKNLLISDTNEQNKKEDLAKMRQQELEKKDKCDFIIENNSSIEDLEKQIDEFLSIFIR